VHDHGKHAFEVAIPKQPRHDDGGHPLDGIGQLFVMAVLPGTLARDGTQAMLGVEVGPGLGPGVILLGGTATSGHGEAVDWVGEAGGDWGGRRVELGELGGERETRAARGG